MAHADSFKSVINRFAKAATTPFVVAANPSEAIDQWTALHLLKNAVGHYESATCSTVMVWKELDSAWGQFFAHVHFDCKGIGATVKKSFSVTVSPITQAALRFFDLSIMDWASPYATVKFKGHVAPFTNTPGEDRVTVKDVGPRRVPPKTQPIMII